MTPTHDKGFLIVGYTKRRDNGNLVYENSYDAFMLKIDSLGQEVWYKTFGRNTSGHDQDEFYKVVQTPDKGYLCAGYTKSWQTQNFFDKGDWWLVKTDSLGVEQWSRRYGHPDYKDGRPYGLLMSSDTSYYVVGAHVIPTNDNSDNTIEASTLLKLNSNFEDEFIRYYNAPTPAEVGFTAIIENTDGDLILGGIKRLDDGFNTFGLVGQLYKLNSDGDSIWRRQYTCLDTTNSQNYPYSIEQTADGGYVFTGIAYDSEFSPAQQVWLVKTDEYGCDGTNEFWDCDTNVGVSEYVSNTILEIYPNPAKKNVQLTINNKQLDIESVEIQIYDLAGKLCKSNIFVRENKIDISHLESGVYIIKMGKNTQKLIVE